VPDFTPTQQRMMAILGDGQLHTRAELLPCLSDEMGCPTLLQMHISLLRKRLRPVGQDIMNGQGAYRLVRHICGRE
jgi:hypothetical protein